MSILSSWLPALLVAFLFGQCRTAAVNKTAAAPTDTLKMPNDCYEGKLIIRGMCKQRAVSLISKNAKGLAIQNTWINPEDGKTYQNVFSVNNICDFPENVQEGDTLRFRLIAAPQKRECMVCMAYIPVPDSANAILVGCDTARNLR